MEAIVHHSQIIESLRNYLQEKMNENRRCEIRINNFLHDMPDKDEEGRGQLPMQPNEQRFHFDHAKYFANIILNVYDAEQTATTENELFSIPGSFWEDLLALYDKYVANQSFQHQNDKARLGLQMIYILTKIDIKKLRDGFYSGRLMKEAYVGELSQLLVSLNEPSIDFKVSEKWSKGLKKFLVRDVIVYMFRTVIHDVLNRFVEPQTLVEWIKEARIYTTVKGVYFHSGFQGVVLFDGWYMKKELLRTYYGPQRFAASSLILAAHECGHYLVRRAENSFRFNSPTTRAPDRNLPRKDPVVDQNKEIGRCVELKLTVVECDWKVSNSIVAATFVRRAKERETLPLIDPEEFKPGYFVPSLIPSVPFGGKFTAHDFQRR